MKSKYKVGDTVILKKEYDPGCGELDYPCAFTLTMLELPEKTAVISKVRQMGPIALEHHKSKKMYTEPFKYYLQNNIWTWVSSMFEDISEEL